VGFSALPLLAAGWWLLSPPPARRPLDAVRLLAAPLLAWSLWGAFTWWTYGAVHFLGGVALVGQKSLAPSELANQLLSLPVYYGVALGFPMLAWLGSLRRGARGTELAVAGALAGIVALWFVLPQGTPVRRAPLDWEEGLLGAWGFAGAIWVWGLSLWWGLRSSRREDLFLCLWLGGTLCFSGGINWHVNAADALMAAPPVLLLWFRHDMRPTPRVAAAWTVLLGLVSVALVAADVRQRAVYREAAADIAAEIAGAPGARWSVGQWGFQYYLAREGFEPIRAPQYRGRFPLSEPEPGDWVASARNVSQLDVGELMSGYRVAPVRIWQYETALPLRVTNPDAGGGFYSHHSGFVPFAWSAAPLDEIGLARITRKPR
jgi:hypothetical protein